MSIYTVAQSAARTVAGAVKTGAQGLGTLAGRSVTLLSGAMQYRVIAGGVLIGANYGAYKLSNLLANRWDAYFDKLETKPENERIALIERHVVTNLTVAVGALVATYGLARLGQVALSGVTYLAFVTAALFARNLPRIRGVVEPAFEKTKVVLSDLLARFRARKEPVNPTAEKETQRPSESSDAANKPVVNTDEAARGAELSKYGKIMDAITAHTGWLTEDESNQWSAHKEFRPHASDASSAAERATMRKLKLEADLAMEARATAANGLELAIDEDREDKIETAKADVLAKTQEALIAVRAFLASLKSENAPEGAVK